MRSPKGLFYIRQDGPISDIYRKIARRVAVRIADKARDMSMKFPSIVVQNT